jgi:glucose/mannose-6-phosphate isomerase
MLVLLRDAAHELETDLSARIETAKEIIKNRGGMVFELWSTGKCELARLLSLSYLGDFVSTYLAMLKGVDPVDIHNIELVKNIGLANPDPKIV